MSTYPIIASAVDPIHHGAGTSGNTSLLRTQEIVTPDGTTAVVPFVSGNSLRHRLRASSARHALEVMGVAPRSLSKSVVDLLFSGGALTKSGSNVNLDVPRQVAELYPALTLFGYSAGSQMQAGKLRVDNLHLVCRENGWRMPEAVRGFEGARLRAGAFRGEEFGTRHDAARSADGTKYTSWLAALSDPDTTQMIYDFQVVKPGAVFWGALHLDSGNSGEAAALAAAVSVATNGGRELLLGAKAGVGFGRTELISGTELPSFDVSEYEAHLAEHSDEIVDLWQELVK